jgi:hypothetical protein
VGIEIFYGGGMALHQAEELLLPLGRMWLFLPDTVALRSYSYNFSLFPFLSQVK